jgi:hypothetical protein
LGLTGIRAQGSGKRLHNEEPYGLYSPSVIWVVKSRKISWEGGRIWHVWGRNVRKVFWWGGLRERDHLEDLEVDGRIILKCIFKTWGGAWTGFMWLRVGTGGGLL